MAGADKPKCGSFANKGLPLVVSLPLKAQLFDPTPSLPPGSGIEVSSVEGSFLDLSSAGPGFGLKTLRSW